VSTTEENIASGIVVTLIDWVCQCAVWVFLWVILPSVLLVLLVIVFLCDVTGITKRFGPEGKAGASESINPTGAEKVCQNRSN
jgi:hypothetical protein